MRSERARIDNRLAALEKRAAWLKRRIESSEAKNGLMLSFDRQELSALEWALPLLRGMIEGERAEKKPRS